MVVYDLQLIVWLKFSILLMVAVVMMPLGQFWRHWQASIFCLFSFSFYDGGKIQNYNYNARMGFKEH